MFHTHSLADEYHCSGNVEIDFLGLCILLDIKDIPAVKVKHPVSSTTDTDVEDTGEPVLLGDKQKGRL